MEKNKDKEEDEELREDKDLAIFFLLGAMLGIGVTVFLVHVGVLPVWQCQQASANLTTNTIRANLTANTISASLITNTTVLFNQYISINPYRNTTICLTYTCTNYTMAGNLTLNFNIAKPGYLVFNSSSPLTLYLALAQHFASPIPQNYEYYSNLGFMTNNTFLYSSYNSTTGPVALPVLPGTVLLHLYNYNPGTYNAQITIKYVSYEAKLNKTQS
jgi:hypothetical protein